MRKLIISSIVALVAFHAAVAFLIYRVTEPGPASVREAQAAARAVPVGASAPAPPRPPAVPTPPAAAAFPGASQRPGGLAGASLEPPRFRPPEPVPVPLEGLGPESLPSGAAVSVLPDQVEAAEAPDGGRQDGVAVTAAERAARLEAARARREARRAQALDADR